MTVEIKVRHTRNAPPGPSSRPGRYADVNVVVKIPYRRLPCAGVEQEVIWMAVAIKVRHPYQTPALGEESGQRLLANERCCSCTISPCAPCWGCREDNPASRHC